MTKEFFRKAKLSIERAEKLLSPHLSEDNAIEILSSLMDSLNWLASALLNRIGSVERDYLILKGVLSEGMKREFNELYFYISMLRRSEIEKASPTALQVNTGKDVFLLTADDLRELIERTKEAWRKMHALIP